MPNMKVRFLPKQQWPVSPFAKECPIVKSNKLYHGSNYSIMTRKFLLNKDGELNVIISSSANKFLGKVNAHLRKGSDMIVKFMHDKIDELRSLSLNGEDLSALIFGSILDHNNEEDWETFEVLETTLKDEGIKPDILLTSADINAHSVGELTLWGGQVDDLDLPANASSMEIQKKVGEVFQYFEHNSPNINYEILEKLPSQARAKIKNN